MSRNRSNRAYTTELAQTAIEQQQPLEWFEPFYACARGRAELIPWADLEPNPNLVEWTQRVELVPGKEVLVVGCGLGDDADLLARTGAQVVGFDISSTAVSWARSRFNRPNLCFEVGDLLRLASHYQRRFSLVVAIYTLQVLPQNLRAAALEAMSSALRPGGELLIICRGRDDDEPLGELPWGVSRRELQSLQVFGCEQMSFEDYIDTNTGSRRFRARYRRTT